MEIIYILDGLFAGTPISGYDEHAHMIMQQPSVEAYTYALHVTKTFV